MKSTTTILRLTNPPIDYIKYYINFFYYVGICPFAINYDKGSKIYWIKSCKFIKIIAVITNILSLIPEVQRLVELLIHQSKSSVLSSYDLSTFFEIIQCLTSIYYRLVIFELFWYKAKVLLELMQLFERPNSFFTKRNIMCDMIVASQIIWMIFVPIAEILLTQIERSGSFYNNDCSQNQYFLFYSNRPTLKIDCSSYMNSKPIFIGFSILNDVIHIYDDFAIRFGDGFFLLASTILVSPVDQFCELVSSGGSTLEQILEYYESLKQLSRKLNEVVGLLIFAGTVCSLPSLVRDLTIVAIEANFIERLRPIVYIFIVISFFGLCMTVDKKANVLEEYLLRPKNYSRFPKEKLTILLYEMQNNKIGLYGAGIFKITAGLFGTVLNLLLSFSIIFMQMKSQPGPIQTLVSSNSTL